MDPTILKNLIYEYEDKLDRVVYKFNNITEKEACITSVIVMWYYRYLIVGLYNGEIKVIKMNDVGRKV